MTVDEVRSLLQARRSRCSRQTSTAEESLKMSDHVYVGRCLCQAVRYSARGAWRDPCLCHCESCRRAAGAPFVAWATIDRSGFEILSGELKLVASSPDVRRGFCAACGTSLTYSHGLRDRDLDVTTASLDDPSLVVPQAHIWVRDKLPWVTIADGLPQYRTAERVGD